MTKGEKTQAKSVQYVDHSSDSSILAERYDSHSSLVYHPLIVDQTNILHIRFIHVYNVSTISRDRSCNCKFVIIIIISIKYTWICIARLRVNASNALRYGSHSVTCKQHHICLYSQSQSITALWPVLIAPTHGEMTRLS